MTLRRDLGELKREPLPFAVILVLAAAGYFEKSPWFIVYGTLMLSALNFRLAEYRDLVSRAWRNHGVITNGYVWGSIVFSNLCFAVASFGLGLVVRKVFALGGSLN